MPVHREGAEAHRSLGGDGRGRCVAFEAHSDGRARAVGDGPGFELGDEVGTPFVLERLQPIGRQVAGRRRLTAALEALPAACGAEHDDERGEKSDRRKEAAHGHPHIGTHVLAMIP
jgi:hypothetical protein